MSKKELIYGICDLLKRYADELEGKPIQEERPRIKRNHVEGFITISGIHYRMKKAGMSYGWSDILDAIEGIGIRLHKTEGGKQMVKECTYDLIVNYLNSR